MGGNRKPGQRDGNYLHSNGNAFPWKYITYSRTSNTRVPIVPNLLTPKCNLFCTYVKEHITITSVQKMA